jgi:hypothetical protein
VQSKQGYNAEGSNRVIRGGSWNNNAENCRVANRNNDNPENRWNNNGFRVAFAPNSKKEPNGRISAKCLNRCYIQTEQSVKQKGKFLPPDTLD